VISSGASTKGYVGWGLYGSTKAAINHLAYTLQTEEPEVTSISLRPGMVDTQMQVELRTDHAEGLGKDASKFTDAYKYGKLLKPEQPGHVIANLVLNAPLELSGAFLK
jgi:NAD(P)-dependent dehydrogenase (short-subunit alcohol dehydrogenase family)